MPESNPCSVRRSHPPLLGPVWSNHSAIVARLVGRLLELILAVSLHTLPVTTPRLLGYANRLVRARSPVSLSTQCWIFISVPQRYRTESAHSPRRTGTVNVNVEPAPT